MLLIKTKFETIPIINSSWILWESIRVCFHFGKILESICSHGNNRHKENSLIVSLRITCIILFFSILFFLQFYSTDLCSATFCIKNTKFMLFIKRQKWFCSASREQSVHHLWILSYFFLTLFFCTIYTISVSGRKPWLFPFSSAPVALSGPTHCTYLTRGDFLPCSPSSSPQPLS